ncbi:reverse transcriptase [Gossypium australe]|uniref:Reverse transcriptase n=1 Tax=Gossypium australe TaxID=47621 RepID=A0A5B6WFI0_9ROSI|nr:reverse transcriptase [Gossypium australe]
MEESGGIEGLKETEVSLLAEELIQLSVKSSKVDSNGKPALICTVWTKKTFNPDSFCAQMKSIWKTKGKFEIQLAGIIRFEINGGFCQIRVALDVQKPLRRGIFVSTGDQECSFFEKESVALNGLSNRIKHQSSYTGQLRDKKERKLTEQEDGDMRKVVDAKFFEVEAVQNRQEEGIIVNKEDSAQIDFLEGNLHTSRKASWRRLHPMRDLDLSNTDLIVRKWKLTDFDNGGYEEDKSVVEEVKRQEHKDQTSESKEESVLVEGNTGWNVCDLGNPRTVMRLRFMLKQQNPDMVFFMETKVNNRRMERIRRRSGFTNGIDVGADGSRGGLCLTWREGYKFIKGIGARIAIFVADHCPLLIHTDNEDKVCRTPQFKFEAWWTLEESFEEEVKNKSNWLLLGDRNSAFFHKYASARRRTNTISRLESEEGQEVTDDLEINEIASNYFQNLFSTKGVGDLTYLLEGIGTNISSEINSALLSTYSVEEIQKALKGMGPTKAPGFDGFPALFFQKYWHIAGKDVEAFCLGVLNEGKDFESTNRTDIVLIPKSSHPTNLVAFRPTSLCTILYKLVAKTIANRLQDFIGKCIDSAQSAFVPSRLISDNVLIAYEILHTLPQKRSGKKGLMAVKLDMSKAYVRVEWSYEGLSALIKQAVGEGVIKGVKASRRGPAISHLFSNIQEGVKEEITDVLGMRHSTNIEKYLGLSSVIGKRRKASFQILKDRVNQRISHWSSRYLSQGGKEVFIKSVLQAIPTYAMTCFPLPKSLCGELENIFAKYWWQHDKGRKGIHWCQWKFMCRSKEEGGMGFRNMAKFNISLLAKQGWRIMNNTESLVTKVLKAKYFPDEQFLNSRLGNSSSYTWKSIWATKDVLRNGLIWRASTGSNISINYDAWIPNASNFRLSTEVESMRDHFVNTLIDDNERIWKEDLIEDTFAEEDAVRILQISLADIPHDDYLAWRGEASGGFSVRSAYKLLHTTDEFLRAYALQTSYKNLYKKLWLLNLPTKIKITVWKITWNFLPTRVNLKHKKLAIGSTCPRCGEQAETIDHLFRECPVTKETWSTLLLQDVLLHENWNFEEWLIWVFEQCNLRAWRLFRCALWAIWGNRNLRIHEKKVSTGTEIGNFVISYIAELDGLERKKLTQTKVKQKWRHPPRGTIKINFDGAFDGHTSISASRIVIRNTEGATLFSCSKIHKGVPSAFATEALACRKAVRMGVENMWSEVIIEGDSLFVINKCRSRDKDKSLLGAYISDIKQMVYRSKPFVFKHISRSTNTLAHEIATESLKSKVRIYLEGRVPEYA